MRVAYLVLAHTNPVHLARLSRALAAERVTQFVHLDRKSDLKRFTVPPDLDVRFTRERVPVFWGEYSMIEAILLMMREAMSAAEEFHYFVLLSGSDYPLRCGEYVREFFRRMSGTEFISLAPIPTDRAGLHLSKINRLAYPSEQPLMRWVAKAGTRVGLCTRDHRRWLGDVRPYGGSTWWALTRSACRRILSFVEEQKAVCEYFRNTYSSDEMFFHTILANTGDVSRLHRSLVFDDWSAGGIHPANINSSHLNWFESSTRVCFDDAFGAGEILFARKFSDQSTEIVARLDRMIATKGMNTGSEESKNSSDEFLSLDTMTLEGRKIVGPG